MTKEDLYLESKSRMHLEISVKILISDCATLSKTRKDLPNWWKDLIYKVGIQHWWEFTKREDATCKYFMQDMHDLNTHRALLLRREA